MPTDAGPEVAECIWAPQWVGDEIGGLPVCAGLATDEHLARDEANRARAGRGPGRRPAADPRARAADEGHRASTTWTTGNCSTIYFTAPHRVDFRALVRDLAAPLRARVELRQIGPRDEARLQGGIGPCGRDLCCSTFLKDFEPVSVRMAKDQDLPVNPLRIAGACGRLMCCLKYEHPLYQDFQDDARKIGASVDTPEGAGQVVGHNVPADQVVVRLSADRPRMRVPAGQRVRVAVRPTRQRYGRSAHRPRTGRLLGRRPSRPARRLSSVGRAIHS